MNGASIALVSQRSVRAPADWSGPGVPRRLRSTGARCAGAPFARTQLAQVRIGVDPGLVPVAPDEAERVAADRGDALQIAVAVHEALLAAVTLAAGARAPAAQVRE